LSPEQHILLSIMFLNNLIYILLLLAEMSNAHIQQQLILQFLFFNLTGRILDTRHPTSWLMVNNPGLDVNLEPLEYETGMITTRSRLSVMSL
jgi:hypothetical protein